MPYRAGLAAGAGRNQRRRRRAGPQDGNGLSRRQRQPRRRRAHGGGTADAREGGGPQRRDPVPRRASRLTDFAKQKKVFFLATGPLSDKVVWDSGNRYTYRLRSGTYALAASVVPEAAKLKQEALGADLSQLRIRAGRRGRLQGEPQEAAARRRVRDGAVAAAGQGRRRRDGAGHRRRQARCHLQRAVRQRPDQVRPRGQEPGPVHGPRCRQPADRRARVPGPAQGRRAGRMDRDRLSLRQHQHARAQGLPGRVPEEVQRLSAPELRRGLCQCQGAGRRHPEGGLHRHREADRRLPRARVRVTLRPGGVQAAGQPVHARHLRGPDRLEGRQGRDAGRHATSTEASSNRRKS